jgi:hypothetical protein
MLLTLGDFSVFLYPVYENVLWKTIFMLRLKNTKMYNMSQCLSLESGKRPTSGCLPVICQKTINLHSPTVHLVRTSA